MGSRGIPVIAMDCVRSVGTFSKYAKYVKCPDPLKDEASFIEFLLEKGKGFDLKPVLFPTNDLWVFAVSKNMDKLSKYYSFCGSDFSTVDLLLKKKKFSKWASDRGYPVPLSWDFDQCNEITDENYPVIVKPEYRRSDEVGESSFYEVLDDLRFTVLESKEELESFRGKYSGKLNFFMIQEYIRGMSDTMFTVGVYCKKGTVIALFKGRKVRGYPADIGDCVVGEISGVPDSVINVVKSICKDLSYDGIAEFEFKKDSFDGRFRLIEINPRSWSWVGITPYCGVNLPLIAYQNISEIYSGDSFVESKGGEGSVKYIKILEDFQNCLWLYRKSGYPEWGKTFKQWKKSLKCDKLVVAEYDKRDFLPLLFAIYRFFKRR